MATGSRTRNRASRAEKAQATRERILAAATELFIRDSYLQTTMADIARAAGVAVQTLYLSFGSKVAIFSAALDIAIAGDSEPVPLLRRPWFARLVAEPDGRSALDVFVDMAGGVIARHYPLYASMRSGSADPELAELLQRNKALRFETHSAVARELAGKAGFSDQLTAVQAAEVIYTLMSQETYELLVVERGRADGEWLDWVRRHLREELFPG